MLDDSTIAAISTAPGKGAIAVVRLSGDRTVEIARSVFLPLSGAQSLEPFKPLLGHIVEEGRHLDQAVLIYYQAPRSYTGEELVEISLHGSPVLAQKALDLLVRAGARVAEPGEFTLRAFLNGKMDLAQAEAVRDLIESRTLYQARLSAQQLEGQLSRTLQPLKDELIGLACHLESAVEFVEEPLDTWSRQRVSERTRVVIQELRKLEHSFEYGKMVQEGFSLAIVGRTNVGKSSLFNALLYENRAIVADLPGTTRDLITESVNILGLPVKFIDTAGVRQTTDAVEREGVERTLSAMATADLTLLVLDGSEPLRQEDMDLLERMKERDAIIVLNKDDLPSVISEDQIPVAKPVTRLSAKMGTGVDALKELIHRAMSPNGYRETETLIVTNVRHKNCIVQAIGHLEKAVGALEAGLSEEFPLYHYHQAHRSIGEITGEITVEDILGRIFSTFCVGK